MLLSFISSLTLHQKSGQNDKSADNGKRISESSGGVDIIGHADLSSSRGTGVGKVVETSVINICDAVGQQLTRQAGGSAGGGSSALVMHASGEHGRQRRRGTSIRASRLADTGGSVSLGPDDDVQPVFAALTETIDSDPGRLGAVDNTVGVDHQVGGGGSRDGHKLGRGVVGENLVGSSSGDDPNVAHGSQRLIRPGDVSISLHSQSVVSIRKDSLSIGELAVLPSSVKSQDMGVTSQQANVGSGQTSSSGEDESTLVKSRLVRLQGIRNLLLDTGAGANQTLEKIAEDAASASHGISPVAKTRGEVGGVSGDTALQLVVVALPEDSRKEQNGSKQKDLHLE